MAMKVVSLAPVPVASVPWKIGESPWVLTVVCKLTMKLEPGELALAKRNDPLYEQERFRDDDVRASVLSPSDLVPSRPLVDVTLVGDAFAPPEAPTRAVTTRLVVQSIDKKLTVESDNGPFVSASLGYEHAETRHSVMGAASGNGSAKGHHIVAPVGALAGYGPLASHWPERVKLLRGGVDPQPFEPGKSCALPADFDLRFFNAAPPEQQLPELAPNADLVLENLHPRYSFLRTRLPNAAPQVFVERKGRRKEHAADISALWIDTLRCLVAVTWHCHIPLDRLEQSGKVFVAVAGPGRRLTTLQLANLIGMLGGSAERPPDPGDEPTADEVEQEVLNETVAYRRARRKEETLTSVLDQESFHDLAERTGDPAPEALDASAEHVLDDQTLDPRRSDTGPLATDTATNPGEPSAATGASAITASVVGGPGSAAPPSDTAPPPMRPPTASTPPLSRPISALPTGADGTRMGLGPTTTQRGAASNTPDPPSGLPASGVPAPSSAAPERAVSLSGAWMPRPPTPSTGDDTSSLPKLAPVLPAAAAEQQPGAAARRSGVELLWLDPDATEALRRRWPELCDQLEFAPRDPRHDLPTRDVKKARDHHIHFGVLTEAPGAGPAGLANAMRDAVGEGGRFTPPLVSLTGKLALPFDDAEVLRATAAIIKPLAADDKRMVDALAQAGELLETPLRTPDAIGNFTRHLRKLWSDARRSVSLDYIDNAASRAVLEQRRYQKRGLFGATVIRASFTPDGADKELPAYLPEQLQTRLPLMQAFDARLIAECHVRQDQYEQEPHALRVVTLGRVVGVDP